MKDNKLISMTALHEDLEDYVHEGHNYERAFNIETNYKEFIQQPLTLGMFIPCDLEGNVLEMPEGFNNWTGKIILVSEGSANHRWSLRCRHYQQAKERVLFEGYDMGNNPEIRFRRLFFRKTVESIINYDLTLTPNALKQIKGS